MNQKSWITSIGFVVLLLATVICMGVLSWLDKPLTTYEAPLGIVSFELPASAAASREIIRSWGEAGITRATQSLRLDFVFALLYAVTLAVAWALVGQHVRPHPLFQDHPKWGAAVRWLIRTCMIASLSAGLLDWAENGILLWMLAHADEISDKLANRVHLIASVKFILVFGGAIGVVLAVTLHERTHQIYNRTVRPWFEWVARYPLLAVIAGLILYITAIPDPQNPGLGIQYLFWHDVAETQFEAGWLLGVLIFELSFVGYLLDAEQEKWMWQPDLSRASRIWNRFCYLAGTNGLLLGIIVYRALASDPLQWSMCKGLGIGFVLVLCVWLIFHWGSRLAWQFVPPKIQDGITAIFFPASTQGSLMRIAVTITTKGQFGLMHWAAALFFIVILLSLAATLLSAEGSAAAAICVLLAFVAGVYGRLVYSFRARYFGWIAFFFVVLAVALGFRTYPHRFDGMAGYYRTENLVRLDSIEQTPTAEMQPDLLDDFQVVKDWQRNLKQHWQNRPAAAKPKLVVVTVSGGGIRAAVWAAAVLAHLERNIPDFPYHVRVLTGTSGGMLGAAYYVETLPNPETADLSLPHHAGDARDIELRKLVDNIAQESLSAAARTLLTRDIALALVNAARSDQVVDRGTAIERRWEEVTGGSLKNTLASLAPHESNSLRPSLIFAPFLVEDGRRLLISNLDLAHLASSTGSYAQNRQTYARSAVEFYKLFPRARNEFRLSTAVRMNASFAYISPAGVLPTIPPRRVADAGYYDNYGVNVAAAWLDRLARQAADDATESDSEATSWLKENVSGVILVQIVDHPTEHNRTKLTLRDERPRSPLTRGNDWLTTPLAAVLGARTSTMLFRNYEQIEQLDQFLNAGSTNNGQIGAETADGQSDFFTTFSFEFTGHVSLSWYLAKSEVKQLRYCIEGDDVDPLRDTLPPAEVQALDAGRANNLQLLAQLKALLGENKMSPDRQPAETD